VGPVLERFQRFIATFFPGLRFPGLARVSFGIENSEEDIDILIREVGIIAQQRRPLLKTDIQIKMNDFAKNAARRAYT
jgi:cysteine sulfinate desulfinase/cysteine desulfurase-like protein